MAGHRNFHPFNNVTNTKQQQNVKRSADDFHLNAKQQKNNKKQKVMQEQVDGISKAVIHSAILTEIQSLLQHHSIRAPAASEFSDFKVKFQENLEANDDSTLPAAQQEAGGSDTNQLDADAFLDEHLFDKERRKSCRKDFQAIMESRKKLPIWNQRLEILQAVEKNQVVVLCGETGCGKTTQVGQFLLDEAIYSGCGSSFRAICTQPRRIAATSVAQRVAQERCEPCGGDSSSVGYQIRLERRLPRERGSILFCTTGILVQLLQSDPTLDDFSHLVLDEVHERDIMTDFLLTVLRALLPKRPQLRIILMSATINAEIFSQYFNNCPVLVVPGMTHSVKSYYLEDILNKLDFQISAKNKKTQISCRKQSEQMEEEYKRLMEQALYRMEADGNFPSHVLSSLWLPESEESPEDLILELLYHIAAWDYDGAVLIFFPGWTEISAMNKTLMADPIFSSEKYLILPLHSMLSTLNQRQVFDKPPPGVRKIILSTNIAETSITIDDVVFVIDSGRNKQSDYDPKKNLDLIQSDWISLANARQRMGRAGRTQPGVCFRLYSRTRESTFLAHPVPEIKRMRLEELILRIKILKLGKVAPFLERVPEPPEQRTVQLSLELLGKLGALDSMERLTPLGFHMAQIPTDPRTAKLILMGAIFGCLEPILNVAAVLTFKDPFVMSLQKSEEIRHRKKELARGLRSDHLLIAKVMIEFRTMNQSAARNYCNRNFLNFNTMSMLKNMVDQFCRDLYERQFISSPSVMDPAANVHSGDERLIRAVLCAGLFPNIATVKFKKGLAPANAGPYQPRPISSLTTAEDGQVFIHPGSVNSQSRELQSSWLCYHGKVKTTTIFLHDCSEVSPLPLLFFGGRASFVSTSHIRGISRVEVAPKITLLSDQPTLTVLESLRTQWNDYLSYRVSHPGPTDWSEGSPDSALLRAIILFVTADDGGTTRPLQSGADNRLNSVCSKMNQLNL